MNNYMTAQRRFRTSSRKTLKSTKHLKVSFSLPSNVLLLEEESKGEEGMMNSIKSTNHSDNSKGNQ